MNEFTFDDKGFSQYAGLFLALWVAGLTLYAFVVCARMNIGKKKWVWMVAMLVGIGRAYLNWTTGQWFFTPFALQTLFPLGASCTPYGPWMLHIYSPVAAIAFLRLRKGFRAETLPLHIASTQIRQQRVRHKTEVKSCLHSLPGRSRKSRPNPLDFKAHRSI